MRQPRRGSRAVRGGPTRGNEAWVRRMRETPLPDDRREAAVEQALRSYLAALARDMRFPTNKRAAEQASRRYQAVVTHHMARDHDHKLTPKHEFGFVDWYDPEGNRVWNMEKEHAKFHQEEGSA